jgi:hypothetical protein
MKYKCHPNYGWGTFHMDEKIRTKFNGEPMSYRNMQTMCVFETPKNP